MGKTTGFMDYERKDNKSVIPSERIKGFKEFHTAMQKSSRQIQGSRCMNCGVPFCQSAMKLGGMVSGCPLHNLIPEWNDEIFCGNWENALRRLTKTNSFPEFTGRVCPALCEAACSCGLYGDAVTIKENELAIIENGFKNGFIKPNKPAVRTGKKVAVIGSGPSGLACAERLNSRGHSVTVYEKDDRIGGLLMYGIPNMKLDKSIVDRRIKLMHQEGIEFKTNSNIGKDISAESIKKDYDAIVICCGAGNPRDLKVENREIEGVYFAVDFLKSTTKALLDNGLKSNYITAKNKNVIVVGGGDTGNDCVGTCIRHGCKSVTQLEMMPKLPDSRSDSNPWPQYPRVCKTDYGQEEAISVFGHDPRLYCTTVKKLIPDDNGKIESIVTVSLTPSKDATTGRTIMKEVPESEKIVKCDLLLIAAGFVGIKEYIAKAFDVKQDPRGNIVTKENSHMSYNDKIFVAGDSRRGQSLVVWAISEGREAAKEIDEYLMGYTNLV